MQLFKFNILTVVESKTDSKSFICDRWEVIHWWRHTHLDIFWSPSPSITLKWLFYVGLHTKRHKSDNPLTILRDVIKEWSLMTSPRTNQNREFMIWPDRKLMWLGLPNRIVVVESNSDFKFDGRFHSDSDFNDDFKLKIAILIKIWSNFD